jgi:hypothetical protein
MLNIKNRAPRIKIRGNCASGSAYSSRMMKYLNALPLLIIFVILFDTKIQFGAPVKGFVPKNDTEYNENCYAYLNGDVKVIFDQMCRSEIPFKIDTNNQVPKVYSSSRDDVIAQIAKEKGPEKAYNPNKKHGARPSLSHFQTIKMIRRPNGARPEFIALAAGDIRQWKSHLFIAQHPQESKLTDGWKVIKRITLNDSNDENDLWHPGGMDICGNYLAIPLEDWKIKIYLSKELYPGVLTHYEKRSKIIFFDISDPINPKRLPVAIERQSGSCPAIAFTRLDDGKFLVYSGGGGDVFISKTSRIEDGFDYYSSLDRAYGQNLSFVTIGNNGDLYIVGTENTNDMSPIYSGSNKVYLYKFDYDPALKTGSIKKIAENNCNCGAGTLAGLLEGPASCNFNAAANVTPMGGVLALYHYVSGGKIRCTLFGPQLEASLLTKIQGSFESAIESLPLTVKK